MQQHLSLLHPRMGAHFSSNRKLSFQPMQDQEREQEVVKNLLNLTKRQKRSESLDFSHLPSLNDHKFRTLYPNS